jgi:hypothetical protein
MMNPVYLCKQVGSKIQWHVQVLLTYLGLYANCDQAKLDRFKNKHTGQVGYLIGSGPSVRVEDLEKLKGKVTFCFNRFHLAYEKMTFRPLYTVSADFGMIRDFGSQIVNESEGTVFLVSRSRPEIDGDFIWVGAKYQAPSLVFSRKIYHHIVIGGSSLVAAIQLGYFMGIKQFVLYGVDHDFKYSTPEKPSDNNYCTAVGDENHFIKNYRSGKAWCPPQVEVIETSLRRADRFLRSQGGGLINATRGGKLEILERKSFEEVINL